MVFFGGTGLQLVDTLGIIDPDNTGLVGRQLLQAVAYDDPIPLRGAQLERKFTASLSFLFTGWRGPRGEDDSCVGI